MVLESFWLSENHFFFRANMMKLRPSSARRELHLKPSIKSYTSLCIPRWLLVTEKNKIFQSYYWLLLTDESYWRLAYVYFICSWAVLALSVFNFFLKTWLIPGMCSVMRLWMELSKLKELKRMLRWTRERRKLLKVFFLSLFTFVNRIIAWNKRLCLFLFVGLQRRESLVSGWPPWKTMMLYLRRLVLNLLFVYLELLQS